MSLLSSSEPVAVLTCEDYGRLKKLLRVTAYVLKFANAIKNRGTSGSGTSGKAGCTLVMEDLNLALTYWLKISQSPMLGMNKFQQ